jgi:glycosyltransferase involved in cell wall biosynthesis
MNILLLNQYYPPDLAPTGGYLHDLAKRLAARGHQVRVLASRTSYNGDHRYAGRETMDGVEIRRIGGLNVGRRRLLLKACDYAWFLLRLAARLRGLRPAPDFILCLTTPPFAGALVRAFRKRGAAYGHWVMDIYPDVLFAHGMLDAGSWTARRLAGLARYTFGGGAFAIGLGPDMAERIAAYTPPSCRVEAIPLWPPASVEAGAAAAQAARKTRGGADGETVFMYSGNMGLGPRFGEFLGAVEATATDTAIRWVFSGGGKRRAQIERFAASHPDARLELMPYVESERLAAHLLSADVQLMSLDRRWEGCMIPSKLQAICRLGRPILFVGGRDNSPARWIVEYEAGWVVAEDDTDGLRDAVQSARNPAERARRGAGAQRLAAALFDPVKNGERLCELIEQQRRQGAGAASSGRR